jgi:multidrug transporter EmrE-like cation transporter
MVIGCTLFAGAAQIMMKFGAAHPMPAIDTSQPASLFTFALALLANLPLVAGYALSACNAFLLIMALRDGELSVLYPIYSLSYVWVIALSMYFFHDQLNPWKAVGVLLIMGGVGLLGKVSTTSK